MKVNTQNELRENLLNVRKSFRLLFEYQTKIKDLVKYIGNSLAYSYGGGWPLFSNPAPRRGSGSLDNWAWDWLNMYSYAFHFGGKEIKNKKITLEIRIYNDTGYYDSSIENKNQCRTDTFLPVEEASTKLVFIASQKGWVPDELLKNFSQKENEYKLINEKCHMLAKAYDLALFLDQEHTDLQIQNFVSFCAREDLLLKEQEQKT